MKVKILILFIAISLAVIGQKTNGELESYANSNVNTNGVNAITGAIMNTMLNYQFESMGARDYDITRTYTSDKAVVLYDDKLWRCITTIGVPEAWNAAKWAQLTNDEVLWRLSGTTILPLDDSHSLALGTFPSNSGALRMTNADWMTWYNAAGTSSINAMTLNSSDLLGFYNGSMTLSSAGALYVKSYIELGTTPATVGDIRLKNKATIFVRNAANTGNLEVMQAGSSDGFLFGDQALAISSTGISTFNYAVECDVKLETDSIETDNNLNITSDTTRLIDPSGNELDIYHSGNKWIIASTDTIQIGSSSMQVTPSGDVCIDGDLDVIGNVYTGDSIRIGAYIPTDSTQTTTVGVDTWLFLGNGASNKFINLYTSGFGFTGDTLQYTATDDNYLHIEYGGSISCNSSSETVSVTISVNDVVQPQLTGSTFCKTSGESYPIAGLSNLLQVSQNDKIKILIKSDSGTVITTNSFSISAFKIY